MVKRFVLWLFKKFYSEQWHEICIECYEDGFDLGYKKGYEECRREKLREIYEKLVEEIRVTEREKIAKEIKEFYYGEE